MHGALIDPRVPATEVEGTWGHLIESKDPLKRRWIAHNLQSQYNWIQSAVANGSFGSRFRSEAGLFKSGLQENTLSSDIAAFTQQSLATVVDVFERIVIDQLITVGSMSGPTAFVHNIGFDVPNGVTYAGDASDGTLPFNAKLDVDYSDCPATECDAGKGVDFNLTSTTITASCKRLKAKYSLPAEQDLQSQYGMSLGDRLRGFMSTQMQREIQGEVLAQLIANAATTVVWTAAAPGAPFNALDPKVWASTLYDAIAEADNGIFSNAQGFRGANWIAGDPLAMLRLQQLKKFSITSRDNVPRGDAGEGDLDSYSNYEGVANHKYKLWKFPFMTAETLLLGVKSDAPQEQGFIHATYVPMTDLGTFRDPETACITVGAQTRYGNALLRNGLYAVVDITP